jgi:hypothetical protein
MQENRIANRLGLVLMILNVVLDKLRQAFRNAEFLPEELVI